MKHSAEICKGKGPGQMETSFERVSMIILVGRDDWELFAEKLGLTPAEIRFFFGSLRIQFRDLHQILSTV